MKSFGSPDKYECHLLYKKYYQCQDGYNLNGTKCSKTIDATAN